MGYYTNFKGSIISDNWKNADKEKEVALAIAHLPYFQEWQRYETEEDIKCINDVINKNEHKWYSYETDMKMISKRFPDLTICIYGEGEEQGDIWEHYFKDGADLLMKF